MQLHVFGLNLPPMNLPRRFLFVAFLMAALTTTGCLSNGKLSTVDYNNQIVAVLNATSANIEITTDPYDKTIPNIVTEDITVDITALETSWNAANTALETGQTALTLKSRNKDQEERALAGLLLYREKAVAYLKTYGEMIVYYKNEDYKKKGNLGRVAEFDQNLHTQYNEFIESNNTLVDLLGEFVKE